MKPCWSHIDKFTTSRGVRARSPPSRSDCCTFFKLSSQTESVFGLFEWEKPIGVPSKSNSPRRCPSSSPSGHPIGVPGLAVVVVSFGAGGGSLFGMADSVLRISV